MDCQVNDKPPVTSTSGGYGGMGTYMGWGMAAIYVGGRLPQICLNVRFFSYSCQHPCFLPLLRSFHLNNSVHIFDMDIPHASTSLLVLDPWAAGIMRIGPLVQKKICKCAAFIDNRGRCLLFQQ